MFLVRKISVACMIAAIALSITLTGCGSGSSASHTMSQPQAQAVAVAFSTATSDALSGSFNNSASEPAGTRAIMATVLRDIHPDTANGCTPTANGESCSFPVSANESQPCTDGGTIAVSGTLSGNITNSGSGSLSAQVTLTPESCAVDGVVVNAGTPPVVGTAVINLVDSAPVYPITITESGDINFGEGSCPVSLTYTSTASACTMSGSACGAPISGPC